MRFRQTCKRWKLNMTKRRGSLPGLGDKCGALVVQHPRYPPKCFQAGNSNAVLYLHMEGGLSSLASRGPNPQSSTVVAKLSLDPTSTVNHIGLQRANRYVEIPPGTISHITFFVRTAAGHIIDLAGLGASISFILTIAERGDN